MNEFAVFVMMASLTFGSVEVIKGVFNVYKPEWKFALALAFVFGVLFTLSYGTGLASAITKIEYADTYIPALFMGMDILTTGSILSLGSKGLNAFLELIGINIGGSITKVIEANKTK